MARERKLIIGFPALCLLSIAASLGALANLPQIDVDQGAAGLVLAFCLLPGINALFDWLSYGVTMTLLRAGFDKERAWPLFLGIVDVVAACLLFFALSVAILSALAAANALRGEDLIALNVFLAELRETPERHVWVFAMVASTLLPTLVHLGIGIFSVITWIPSRLWSRLLARLDAEHSVLDTGFASIALACLTCIYFLVPVFLLGFAAFVIWQAGPMLRVDYVNRLANVAHWLGIL